MKSDFAAKFFGRLRQRLLIQEILDRFAKLGLVIYPYRVYTKRLDAGAPVEYPEFADYHFRELTVADLPSMFDILIKDIPIEHLRQRFDRGDSCYGVFHGDSLLGYTCVSRDACYGAKRMALFPLEQSEAYGYSTFVRRSARRTGLHAFMMQNCFEELRNAGVERFYGSVLYFNRIARLAIEKMEYSVIDQRIYFRFFGLFECNPRIGGGTRPDR